jgi:hypothetical protein
MNIRYRGRLISDPEGDELSNEEALHGHALAIARDQLERWSLAVVEWQLLKRPPSRFHLKLAHDSAI